MVLVGAFARIEPGTIKAVVRRLEGMAGVETFELDALHKVGILIEADDADQAHAMLTRDIRGIEGVWGVWPVYMHDEQEQEEEKRSGSAQT